MLRRLACVLALGLVALPLCAQTPAEDAAHPALAQARLAAHIRFLAADELLGRRTGTPGNDVAARYLAEQLRAAGVDTLEGATGYFQPVPFVTTRPPEAATLTLGDVTLSRGAGGLLVLGGGALDAEAPPAFVGHGLEAGAYADAEGAIAVARFGNPSQPGIGSALAASRQKRTLAAEAGAVALVELYGERFPWARLQGYLGGDRLQLDSPGAPPLPHAWAYPASAGADVEALVAEAEAGRAASFASDGLQRDGFASNNVVGVVPGTDPALRDEYVVLMAHYDHLGAGMQNGPAATPADSIFNGARDNGMGTTALLGAAHVFAERPARRSILLLAVTGEEEGLLGSQYYVDHPLVPLRQTVYGMSIDTGGYSDTTVVTLIGKGRTTADSLIARGAQAAAGLTVIDDPAPEQGLFNRSDNVSFARKGVPAPTFSPGFRSFSDPGIANYYHRPQDEADASFDFAYLRRFVQAFVGAARMVASTDAPLGWTPGDPYAEAAAALYGNAAGEQGDEQGGGEQDGGE